MATLKLEVGRPLVLVIDDVAVVDGKFGKQTAFHAGDDTFYMAVDSANKQLDRAGITDPIGLTLEFSKVDIGKGRTAINIKEVTGSPQKAPPSRQEAPRPTNAPNDIGALHDADVRTAYKNITAWVLTDIIPLYVRQGIALDMQAIAAIVNTNFIQASKR